MRLSSYFLLLLLFCANKFSYAQLYDLGVGVKFKKDVSTERQLEILAGFRSEFTLDEQSGLFPANMIIPMFNERMTNKQANELKKRLELYPEIEFCSLLKGTETGLVCMPLQQVYVKLYAPDDIYLLENVKDEFGLTYISKYDHLENVHILQSDKHSSGTSQEIAKRLNQSGLFKHVTHNGMYSLSANSDVNDPDFKRQWAIRNDGSIYQSRGTPGADMEVDSAWTITKGSPTIKIAVLDSGVDTLHPDLVDNLLPGFDAVDNKTNGHPIPNVSADAHGTCCAGIIAATGDNGIGIAGVAYACKIIPVRIYSFFIFNGAAVPITTTKAGIDGMNWAAFNAKADLVSNSWGVHDTVIPLLGIDTVLANEAINTIVKNGRGGKGLPLLFSAGNDPNPYTIWPSNLQNTISVGATSMCDELKNSNDCSPENWGSNHGKGLDVSAPGVRIPATDISGLKGYVGADYYYGFNGTSSACPNAAGVMALILSVDSSFSYSTAREILQSTCDTVGGYDYGTTKTSGSWSMELGYGRINAFNAVKKAVSVKNTPKPIELEKAIGLYPNPTTGNVILNTGTDSISEINIVNLMGSFVDHYTNPPSGVLQLNVTGYSKGIYFVVVKTTNGITTNYKLIKQD